MNKYTNLLLTIILLLLLLNLALTGSVLIRDSVQPRVLNDRIENIDTSIAQDWGGKVTEMYNQQNHQALYALFSEQAKVKISHQQLQTQLEKLFQLFGEIEKSAFVSADKMGERGDERYYKLLFNIRVKQTSKRLATLTLSVVEKDNNVSLYGVRINATHSLE